MLREHLSRNHLLMQLALRYGMLAFIGLHRAWASRSIIARSAVFRQYGALAGLTLTCDNGGIRWEDEGRQGFLRFLDLGR